MSADVEPDPARAALWQLLAGDEDLVELLGGEQRIFHRKAPQGTPRPYVVVSSPSEVDQYTFDDSLQNAIWNIKAVDESDEAELAESIARQLRHVLDDAPLEIEGGRCLYLRRESRIDYGESAEGGDSIHHVGGSYRLISQSTT